MSTLQTPAAPPPADSTSVTTFVPEVVRLRKILVPTDMSPPAEKALHYATQLATQFSAELLLVHVIEPLYPFPVDGMMYFPSPQPHDPNVARRPQWESALKEHAAKLEQSAHVQIQSAVRVGSAYQEIVEAARETEADLIVIATHGFTGLKHFLLGSTAEKVVRHAPCPVLVVREKEREFA